MTIIEICLLRLERGADMNTIYKDAIAQTFVRLCVDHKVKEITVSEIIASCGISRQTFYNHFKDKYDIMEYIFDKAASQATAAMFAGEGYLETAIKEMLYVFQNNKVFYMSVAGMEGQNSFLEFFCQYTVNFYSSIVERLLGKKALTPEIRYQIRFNAYGVGHMVVDYILSGMDESPEVIAPLMVCCVPEDLKNLFQSVHSLNQTAEA